MVCPNLLRLEECSSVTRVQTLVSLSMLANLPACFPYPYVTSVRIYCVVFMVIVGEKLVMAKLPMFGPYK